MSTHTPGPWRVANSSRIIRIFAGTDNDITTEVATVFRSGPMEYEANARLIAAAPELLAALKQLMKAYESVLPGLAKIAVQDYALINDAPVAADRAILKAEGR